MRLQSLLMVLMLPVMAGCSHWPGPEHRDVTLAGIEQLLEEQCQPDPTLSEGLDGIRQSLTQQQQSMADFQASVQTTLQNLPARPVSTVPSVNGSGTQCDVERSRKATPVTSDNKVVIGATEWVYLAPPGRYLSARVDTGAETSSISARNIVRFERDGKRWVSFDLDTGNADNDIHLEAPLERNVRIRQASFDDIDRRPVVVFDVRLGDKLHQPTEFTLADRSRMSYPVLLGRSFLKDMAVVDVGQEFIHPRSKNR